jgi:hypothetical protein
MKTKPVSKLQGLFDLSAPAAKPKAKSFRKPPVDKWRCNACHKEYDTEAEAAGCPCEMHSHARTRVSGKAGGSSRENAALRTPGVSAKETAKSRQPPIKRFPIAQRFKGCPPICDIANLPSFKTLDELQAFVEKGCSTTDAKWQCHKCGGWHFWSHGASVYDSSPRIHDGVPARIKELIGKRIKPDGMTMLKNAVRLLILTIALALPRTTQSTDLPCLNASFQTNSARGVFSFDVLAPEAETNHVWEIYYSFDCRVWREEFLILPAYWKPSRICGCWKLD